MIDFGSRMFIFSRYYPKVMLQLKLLSLQPVATSEKYLDLKNQPLEITCFAYTHVKVGKKANKRARLNVTKIRRSLIGRDWLRVLKHWFITVNQIATSE